MQDNDSRLVEECMERFSDTGSVVGFLPGGGIYRLEYPGRWYELDSVLHCSHGYRNLILEVSTANFVPI